MVTPAGSRPSLERWLALVVRYWACNMQLAQGSGMRWPGFGYSDAETAELAGIAAACDRNEFFLWLGLTVVLYLVIAALVVVVGMDGLILAIGGAQHMADTPAVMFFFVLGLELVVAMSIGFPAAMLPAAALTGRFFGVADSVLPAQAVTARLFRKLWLQIARVALLAVAALAALWCFVPADSKVAVLARLVMPLLSPAVAALTAAYYFAARVRRG